MYTYFRTFKIHETKLIELKEEAKKSVITILSQWNEVRDIVQRRQRSRPSPWKRNAKKQNGCLGRPCR